MKAKLHHSQKFLHQISFRIFLLAGFAVLLGALSFFFLMVPKMEEGLMEKKREMLREVVNLAYSELENVNKQYLLGEITFQQAQQEAKYHINNLRYGPEKKDYFWINDVTPKMIVHPYRSDLIGQDLSHFQDEKGKLLFVEFVKVVKKDGEGFVDYMWQWKDNPHRIVPKISFVKEFKEWGWIVGSGLYIDDVKKDIAKTVKHIIIIITGVMTIVTLVSSYAIWISFRIEKNKNLVEQKLVEKEIQYQEFIEHTPIGIYRRGKNDELIMANPAFYDILGCKKGDNISCNTIFKDIQEKDNIIQYILQHGQITNHEVQLIKNNGQNIWVSLNARAKFDKKGNVEYFDGVVEDISDRKKVEEKLKELDDKKNEFIGIVSHELRTPLTSIKGYLDMILDGDYGELTPQMKETIDGVYHNSDRLINLVNDMLDITKLEAGKIEFIYEKFLINEVIKQVFETYKNIANEKQIECILELDADVFIYTDKQKLTQVMINLISNACKFTLSGGKIILKTIILNSQVQISVEDSGIGIAKSDYEVVFSKFGQVSNLLSDKQKGTGLGLSIVKEILSQMGSEIHLSSQIGVGSIFSFSFPIYKE